MSASDVRQRLFEVAQRGDLDALLAAAHEAIGLPLVVMDAACLVVAKYPIEAQPGCEHWNSYRPGEQVPSSYIHTAWREGHMARLRASNAPMLIDWGFAEHEPRLTQELRWRDSPIGYIIALAPGGAYTPAQLKAVAVLAELATFLLALDGQHAQARATFANALFYGLLTGSLATEEAIEELVESSKLDLPGRYVVVAAPRFYGNPGDPHPDAPLLYASDSAVMLPYVDGDIVYLLVSGIADSFGQSSQRQRVVELLEAAGVSAGVSQPFGALSQLRDYCWQALRALELGSRDDSERRLHYFGGHALEAVAQEVHAHVPASVFPHPALRAIGEYDAAHDADLKATLAAYLFSGGDTARAAEELHVHKNTLRYRLERIREIGPFDLDDYDSRVLMYLSLVYEKLQEKGG